MSAGLFTNEKKELIAVAAREHGLRLVLGFGSTVTGKLHELSDIDIGVLTEEPDISFDLFADVVFDLSRIFPEYEVDLVILNHADPLLLKQIAGQAKLLFGDPRVFNEFKIYAYKRYVDHKPYLNMEKRFAVEYPKRAKRAAS